MEEAAIRRGIPRDILDLFKIHSPDSYRFLTMFPYKIFPIKRWEMAPNGSDTRTQLAYWMRNYIFAVSRDSYDRNYARRREETKKDREIILLASHSGASLLDENVDIIQKNLAKTGIPISASSLLRMSRNNIREILLTGYLKPLFNFIDYDENFIVKVLKLREMESQSTTEEELSFVHQQTSYYENFQEYLNPDKDLDVNPNSDLVSFLPKDLKSEVLSFLGHIDQKKFLGTSKTNRESVVLECHLRLKDRPNWTVYDSIVRSLNIVTLDLSFYDKKVNDLDFDSISNLNSLKKIIFPSHYNKPLRSHYFPSNLKSVTLGRFFDQPIDINVFPDSLEELNLGDEREQPLEIGSLPPNLRSLKFGWIFDQPLEPGVFPSSLEKLEFQGIFNETFNLGVLPAGLKILVLGRFFNQPLGSCVFPSDLQTLILKNEYDQPIEKGDLPIGLKELIFQGKFNQPLKRGVLPPNLRVLKFMYDLETGDDNKFNQPIEEGVLPSTLEFLEMGESFEYPFGKNVLPRGLKTLTVKIPYSETVLPPNLESITLSHDWKNPIKPGFFPDSVREIIFSSCSFDEQIYLGVLPPFLETLEFRYVEYNYKMEIGFLPQTLLKLMFIANFNQPFEPGVLPHSLETLKLPIDYEQNFGTGVLPENLKYLYLHSSYSGDIIKTKNLKVIRHDCDFTF